VLSAVPRLLLAIALVLAAAAATAHAQGSGADGEPQEGIWISRAELGQLPTTGPAWSRLSQRADEDLGEADIADQDTEHDVTTFAAALVSARTGSGRLREKAATGIMDAIGTEEGGRTLALSRGLMPYVLAADLIDLRGFDADKDRVFRRWLRRVRTERLEPRARPTLVATHEFAANNWGTHAGASRIAADVYLGDEKDLRRAAAVFKDYTGDRDAYAGFNFGEDQSWQADPKRPVPIVAEGAREDGQRLDGALPDDMRRGCERRPDPCPTRYPWEAMQGIVAQANLLTRQGYDAWEWGDQAVRRAAEFLFDLNERSPHEDWAAPAGNEWIPWLLNARYGTDFEAKLPAQPGKAVGFTDWTDPEPCPRESCTAPASAPLPVEPAAPAPQPVPRAEDQDEGTPAAAIAGAAAVVLVALTATALLLVRRRARRTR
jgi:Alginate lyase